LLHDKNHSIVFSFLLSIVRSTTIYSLSHSLFSFITFTQTRATHKKKTDRQTVKEKCSLNKIKQSNSSNISLSSFCLCQYFKMTPRKYSYTFLAQAETLLIYGIFLFLTGLAQICVTITHRYIIERTIQHNENIQIRNLFPIKFTKDDIHIWFIYPSSALVSLTNETMKNRQISNLMRV